MVNVNFTVNLNNPIMKDPVEFLNLDTREYHVVKRCGLKTVGDVVNNLERIRTFKGCGEQTYNGILKHVFEYYIDEMTAEELDRYAIEKVKVYPV